MTEKQNWLAISNWVPIITSTLMIGIAFGGLMTRLALIEQKQGDILAILEKREEKEEAITLLVNNHEIRLRLLEE